MEQSAARHPSLSQLTEELFALRVRKGRFKADDLSAAVSFLALPRYLPLPPERAQELLLADIRDALRELSQRDRTIAEHSLRYRASDLGATKRSDAAAEELVKAGFQKSSDGRWVRSKEPYVLAQIAFLVYRSAIRSADWDYRHATIDIDLVVPPEDPLLRVSTQSWTIEMLRENVSTFRFASEPSNAHYEGPPEVLSEGHTHVGSVPIDTENPEGPSIHFVFMGKWFPTGAEQTVVVRQSERQDYDKPDSYVSGTIVAPVDELVLRAHVSRDLAASYRCIEFPSTVPTEAISSRRVFREDEAPMEWRVPEPEQGHYYRLEWTKP